MTRDWLSLPRRSSRARREDSGQRLELDTLRRLTADVQVAADQVTSAIQKVYLALGRCRARVQGIREHAGAVEGAVHDVAALQGNCATQTQQIVTATRQVQEEADHLAREGAALQEEAKVSRAQLSSILQRMGRLLAEQDTAVREAAGLADLARSVDQVLTAIGDIAERTHLLALNASIEAARVGAEGQAFGVIASGVRDLAGQAGQAAREATNLLVPIAEGAGRVLRLLSQGKEQLGVTIGELQQLLDLLGAVDRMAERLSTATARTREVTELAHRSIEEVAGFVQRAAEQGHQTLQATRTVHGALAELQRDHEELEALGRFVTEKTDALSAILSPLHLRLYDRDLRDVEAKVAALKELLSRLGEERAILSLEPAAHRRVFEQVLQAHPEIEAIWSNDDQGEFVVSIPPAGILNARSRRWWQEAAEGRAFHSEPYISAITRRPCITVSVPVVRDGRVVGVLGADMAVASRS